MKKAIIRSLIILSFLIAVTSNAQVATKAAQDTSNARLSLIKGSTYRQETVQALTNASLTAINTTLAATNASLSAINTTLAATNASLTAINTTLAATNASLSAINTTMIANTATLTLVKKNNDTLAQSLRQIIVNTDSASIYAARNRNVGGFATKVYTTITTSTVTYTAGDNVGGIITVTNALRTTAGTGQLTDIQIWSTETQSLACTIDIWSASPTGSFVNNTAQIIAGDQATYLGSVTFSASDYVTTGTICRASLKNLNISISGQAARSVFFTIVTSGTPAWTGGTSGFYLNAGFKQD